MNYLIYIEYGGENLQFYLWYRDYGERFEAAGPRETSLAPEWTRAMEDEAVAKIREIPPTSCVRVLRRLAYSREATSRSKRELLLPHPCPSTIAIPRLARRHNYQPAEGDKARHTLHQQWCRLPLCPRTSPKRRTLSMRLAQSCRVSPSARSSRCVTLTLVVNIQPFREEINRVAATYIMDDAPRQLNLSSWEQEAAVQALSYTTHASALRGLIKTVESSLHCQSHPNFVRWSIYNGNPACITFARCLGGFLMLAGFAIALVVSLSSMGRGYRALAAIAWTLGASTLVAACKGMCVVLHGLHHRHVRPWELFEQGDNEASTSKQSLESFGSSNSYEDEPWVVKYEKRDVVRKAFDRAMWTQELALRQIQGTNFIQALLVGVIVGGILTAVFVLVPRANLF